MSAMTEGRLMDAIPSDVSEALPLSEQLKALSKSQLIKFADNLGFQVDARLKEETIREAILKIDADHKKQAANINEESLAATVSEKDPEITVRFFNMESPGADLEFAFPGPRQMFGPKNRKGHKKCPKYHLFPGEIVKLAYSVYEHLSGLTFVTHKTVWDPASKMIKGTIPIIKPRFVLQPVLTKEDLLKINN